MKTTTAGIEYADALVLSVDSGGKSAWLAMYGDKTQPPIKVQLESWVVLDEGIRDVTCTDVGGGDDESGLETDLTDTPQPDEEEWVEVRRKKKGDAWKVHKKHGRKVKTKTYSIPNIANDPSVPEHHHKRMTILWAYMALDNAAEAGGVQYQVKVGGESLIRGRVLEGNKLSKKKRACKRYVATPKKAIKVIVTDAGTTTGSASVKIGYVE